MRTFLLYLLLPLAASSFNLFSIPEYIRNPVFKTYFDASKVETQCFSDIRVWWRDLLLAGLTAKSCTSLECLKDEKITNATYAMKILAASGHPSSLALDEMSLTWAGDAGLCRSIEACLLTIKCKKGPYKTKYCYLHVNIDWSKIDFAAYGISFDNLPGGKMPNINMGHREFSDFDVCKANGATNVKMAFCMPESCKDDSHISQLVSGITNGTARICDISCVGPKEDPNTFFYMFNGFLIGLVLLAIAASFLDYYATSEGLMEDLNEKTGWKLLLSFSIPRNTKAIFSIGNESPDTILCLDAIRFISFTWVANLHADIFASDGDDGLQYFKESDYILSDIFLNSYSSVDTFFLISGLLISYKFFKKVHRDSSYAYDKYQWMMYYVHRWLRLTPAYILFLGVFIAWVPRMHGEWSISTATNATMNVEICEKYWWINALYLSNFVNIEDQCYPISWFLAVDMQLYFVAPIFLLAIYYSWRTGLGAVLGGIAFSIGTTIFLTAHYDIPATGFLAMSNLDYLSKIYMKPWTRCIPHIAGIACGYFIVLVRQKMIQIRQPKKWELAVCWLLSAVFGLAVIFGAYDYIRGHSDWDVALRSLYSCFARIGWSLAVSWVILACIFGWAGPVKTILEHPLWYPLGRLSYCAYITHWFLLHYLLNGNDRPSHFVSLWHTYLTVTIPVVFLSCILAYVWTCLVEIPFGKIEVIVIDLLTSKRGGGGDQHVNKSGTIVTSPVAMIVRNGHDTARSTSIENIPANIRIPLIKTYFDAAKVDTQCFRDIKRWFSDLLLAGLTAQKCKSLDCIKDEKITNATYAMKILAASGRPHSLGWEDLSLTWAGDPGLCRAIEGPYETKYCFTHVHVDWKQIDFEAFGVSLSHFPGGKVPDVEGHEEIDRCSTLSPSNVKVAFCMPASCEKDTDIGRLLSDVTNGTARLCEISCTGPKNEPNWFFYLFNAFVISLVLLVITASLIDYYVTSEGLVGELNKETGWKLLFSFSLPRNTTSIFSIGKEGDSIICLEAIRFISFTWVASLHANVFAIDGDDSLKFFGESEYFFADVFLNSYASVDTFFLISGLLVSYKFFKRVLRDDSYAYDKFQWVMYYVHRWLRLTPSYILFLGLFIAWIPRMHGEWSVSTENNATLFVQNCENYWWVNALYLNNFANVQDMCYPISWFLAVDMQLYWIAPIFLFAIYYSWKAGLAALICGVAFSIGAVIFVTAHYDLPATAFTIKVIGNLDYFNYIYIKPWARCIPYLAGIACGYFIVLVRQKLIEIRKPKKWEITVCWLLSTACALACIFSVYDYIRGQSDWDVAMRSLYGCLSRIGWSAAIAWVIVACTFGWAGPVKTILEHPLWYPLGRLSYCAYIVHWFLLHYLMNGNDRPSHFVSLWHTYLTVTVPVVFLSCIVAYFWSCLVEIPFGKIEVIVVDLLTNKGKVHPEIKNGTHVDPPRRTNERNGKDPSRFIAIEVNHNK